MLNLVFNFHASSDYPSCFGHDSSYQLAARWTKTCVNPFKFDDHGDVQT